MAEFADDKERKERYNDAARRRKDVSAHAFHTEPFAFAGFDMAEESRDDDRARLRLTVRAQWPELTEESIERAIGSIENRRVLILKDGKWMQAS